MKLHLLVYRETVTLESKERLAEVSALRHVLHNFRHVHMLINIKHFPFVTGHFAFHFRPVFSGQRVSAFGRFLFEPGPVLHRLLQVISHFIFALYFEAKGFPLLAGFCLNQAPFCTGCYRVFRISFSPCIFRPKGFRFWQVSL